MQARQLRGLLLNVITYSAAISACEKGQKPQQALHLLQELQLRGLLPNVTTYSAAISACEKGQMPNTTTCDASVAEDAARKPPARRDRLQRGYSALSSAGRQTEPLQRAGQPATVMHPVLVSRGTASPGPGLVPPAAPGSLWSFAGG